MKYIKLYENFLGDVQKDGNGVLEGTTKITIEKDIDDERGTRRKKSYGVIYEYELSGNEIEISGSITPYETGRMTDYKFEPSWFSDGISEHFCDEEYDNIKEAIIKVFYEYFHQLKKGEKIEATIVNGEIIK